MEDGGWKMEDGYMEEWQRVVFEGVWELGLRKEELVILFYFLLFCFDVMPKKKEKEKTLGPFFCFIRNEKEEGMKGIAG